MEQSLAEKLKGEVDIETWDGLSRFFAKGLLVLVQGNLDLVEVGIAMAKDEASKIAKWLEEGEIATPSEAEALSWSNRESSPTFDVLIISPFVVARKKQAETFH